MRRQQLHATRRRWQAPVWWAGVAGWMGVIFALSAQSGGESSGLSDMVVRVIQRVSGGLLAHADQQMLQFAVRKCAHFSAYLVLGLLLVGAWRSWPGAPVRVRSTVRADRPLDPGARTAAPRRRSVLDWNWWGPALIAIGYAASDEFHQSFVTGRSAQVTDVLIDAAGALAGVALIALLTRRARRRRMSPQ